MPEVAHATTRHREVIVEPRVALARRVERPTRRIGMGRKDRPVPPSNKMALLTPKMGDQLGDQTLRSGEQN